MPVEGGARVAIIEGADRMNEDAQSALLKTLEEPPAGVTIVLCADHEARLLPTVRSRCFRVRLGLVGARDIEPIVADHDLADPPTAARLGRLAAGRPGLALAYARAPEAVLIRAELTRVLLDLTDGAAVGAARGRAGRRAARDRPVRACWPPDPAAPAGPRDPPTRRRTRRAAAGRRSRRPRQRPTATRPTTPTTRRPSRPKTPATERRRGVETLLGLWTDVARDLVLVEAGGLRSVRDTVLLEELAAIVAGIEPGAAVTFLDRAARSAELLASNVSPELILDSLVLAWPRRPRGRLSALIVASTRSTARLDATVIGRVQGVGFRYFVLREAMALGLDGWVANTRGRLGPLRGRGSARPARAPPRPAPRRAAAAIVERVSEAWMPATGTLGPFADPQRQRIRATDP